MWRAAVLRNMKTVGVVAYAYCVWHTVTSHIISCVVCVGDSMQPTINSTSSLDIVLVEFWSKKLRKIKQNDIVIAKQPDKPSALICKRITAVEGSDTPADIINPSRYNTVPKGHLWLEGDNLDSSYDSRHFGPLPFALIHSRVLFRVWPPSQVGTVR